MDVIDLIEQKLKKYPEARSDRTEDYITVVPPGDKAFEMSLERRGASCTVYYEGWHEEFSDPDQAAECFAFGLSEYCRLKVDLRGDFPYRWTVESRRDAKWVEDSITGLLMFPFWRRHRVLYLQNTLIPFDDSFPIISEP